MSPFEVDLGWKPKTPLDIISGRDNDSLPTVTEFREQLEESFKSATFVYRLAQAKQAAYNSKKYLPSSYEIGDEVYLSKKLFTDSSSAARPSQNLSVRRVGPFKVSEIINKNPVRIALPDNTTIHPVVHVEHTAQVRTQPMEICYPSKLRSQPFRDSIGGVIMVSRILSHRKRGRGWQFLTLYQNASMHEAEWKPLRDFVDPDNTITKDLHDFIVEHDMLQHLHYFCLPQLL